MGTSESLFEHTLSTCNLPIRSISFSSACVPSFSPTATALANSMLLRGSVVCKGPFILLSSMFAVEAKYRVQEESMVGKQKETDAMGCVEICGPETCYKTTQISPRPALAREPGSPLCGPERVVREGRCTVGRQSHRRADCWKQLDGCVLHWDFRSSANPLAASCARGAALELCGTVWMLHGVCSVKWQSQKACRAAKVPVLWNRHTVCRISWQPVPH